MISVIKCIWSEKVCLVKGHQQPLLIIKMLPCNGPLLTRYCSIGVLHGRRVAFSKNKELIQGKMCS